MKTCFTQSIRLVEVVATDLLVRNRGAYVPADFVILDMLNDRDAPLILGHPFLNTANACIYVAPRKIQFHFAGKKETFAFAPGKRIFDEKQVRKKNSRTRKKNPHTRKNNCEPTLEGMLLQHFHCI